MKNYQKKGWVRLYRQIEDNSLWFLEPFTKAQAWIDLFLNANHKDGILSIRGNIIKIKRGQIGWSELTMASRWKWSKNRTRRFLKLLEMEQQIEQQKTFITTIITVINYEKFQTDETADDTAKGQQKDSRRYTNKNDKNDNNDKNEESETPSQKANNFFNNPELQEKMIVFLKDKGVGEELGRRETKKFISYWTELNKSGTKKRWEMERTFEVNKRLTTWFNRIGDFKGRSGTRVIKV